MRAREPSRTAWSAACYRAAHQLVDGGRLFADPYAVDILGVGEDAVRTGRQASDQARAMRWFIAARSRLATDVALAAAERGSRVVVLGAGLDTFALRHPDLDVWEVDHPATQAWKRDRLAESGLGVPARLRFVAVDFERDDLAERLGASVGTETPRCYLWLGVVPYLTRSAFETTLAVAGRAPGDEVVFDYAEPVGELSPVVREQRDRAMARVAAIGEPWQLFPSPAEVARTLAGAGFDDVDDIGPADFGPRFLGRALSGPRRGAHIVHARRSGSGEGGVVGG